MLNLIRLARGALPLAPRRFGEVSDHTGRSTRDETRRSCCVGLWRALVIVAGLHVYWLLGGTWAVHAASGGAYSHVTTGLRVQSAVIAVLLVAAALVVRVRADLWQPPLSKRVVRVAMWVLTAALALAAVVNLSASTNWERFAIGPFVLVLALLGLMVATPSTRQPPHRRFARTDVNQHLQQGLDR